MKSVGLVRLIVILEKPRIVHVYNLLVQERSYFMINISTEEGEIRLLRYFLMRAKELFINTLIKVNFIVSNAHFKANIVESECNNFIRRHTT